VRIEEGVELARYTTLGTGGPARAFARPETAAEVEELLRWAADQ
jgi:UDP-N-acetylenolpyruvoylglucosamine reductase